MRQEENNAKLIGTIVEPLKRQSEKYGGIYSTVLEVKRLSETVDRIPIRIPKTSLKGVRFNVGTKVLIEGDCRTYNRDYHLEVVIFAKRISIVGKESEDINEIDLTGYICKRPIYRITPLGRKIGDLFIAINKNSDVSYYIPILAWGRNAKYVSTLPIGSRVNGIGRIQSRDYCKIIDGIAEIKTVIEVSCSWVALV